MYKKAPCLSFYQIIQICILYRLKISHLPIFHAFQNDAHIYLFKSPKNDVGRKLDKLGQDFKMGINISRWKICMYFKPGAGFIKIPRIKIG